ncbi:MAG: FecR domain-containing protein [Filimonas sp.]|nr:FecR domain-containing protein [Filimonas sp.]
MTQEELSRLMKNYFDEKATEAEKKQLDDWYNSFNEKDLTIRVYTDEPYTEEMLEEKMKQRLQQSIRNNKNNGSRFFWLYTAAAVILLAVASIFLYQSLSPKEDHVLATRKTERRLVQLPDGTKVWLNADSKLSYTSTFNVQDRQVTLTGEAFFDVAHDSSRPFIIHSGSLTTRVLGTAFNVHAYPGEASSVTVIRGRVEVKDQQQHVTILTPNKQVKYVSDNNMQPGVLKEVKAEQYLSWTKGQLDFTEESYGEIAATLERQFNIAIAFKSAAAQRCTFTASFEKDASLWRVLSLLSQVNQTTFSVNADSTRITIDGNGCQ